MRVRAADVSLARAPPAASTILNILPARVAAAEAQDPAQINVVVRLGAAGQGARLLARVTRKSWVTLGLRPGDLVHAQVKSIALVPQSPDRITSRHGLAPGGGRQAARSIAWQTGGQVMKISARNVLKGQIVGVEKGQTTAHVRIDIGNGKVITASVTNEAVDDLGLRSGQQAYAVVKASNVMIAID